MAHNPVPACHSRCGGYPAPQSRHTPSTASLSCLGRLGSPAWQRFLPQKQVAVLYKLLSNFSANSADSIDLVQLYNIGPTIARRILKYRSLLGGFFCKEQLLEVYGIDSTRFSDIAPYLTVNRSAIVPININTADINRLKRHPYLDYYQAKAIVLLRDANGPYLKVSDILNIPIIDTTTFKRIEPYLSCNSQQNK